MTEDEDLNKALRLANTLAAYELSEDYVDATREAVVVLRTQDTLLKQALSAIGSLSGFGLTDKAEAAIQAITEHCYGQ